MESNSEDFNAAICPSCGGENEKRARFCVHCGNRLLERKRISIKNRYILLGAIGLILTGVISFFWSGGFESKLVGRVNGEGITRSEFSKRVDRAKKFYESRYGQGFFKEQTGKDNLNRLKTDILDEMTVEKILLQEAKSAGYTSAPEEEIGKQVEAIKKQYRLSDP
jgi:ribosomal protein L40E